jgi:uncharacterized protein (DUF2267 family)
MPVDEFVKRVSARAAVPPDTARQYARSVLTTLRDTVRTEFFRVTDQLPGEYRDLVRR